MSAQRHRVINPATEDILWDRDLHTPNEVRTIVRRADAAHHVWGAAGAADRCAVLSRIADRLRGHAPQLAALLTQEQGKPLSEAASEVAKAADVFDYYADPALLGGEVVRGPTARVRG